MSRRAHRCRVAVLASALHLPCVAVAAAQTSVATIAWSRMLDQPPDWYASADAVRFADDVLRYQQENGDCSKNIDMARVLADPSMALVRRTSRFT